MPDFKAKMDQVIFRLGFHSRPRCGSLQRSPDLVAGFKGLLVLRGGRGKDRVEGSLLLFADLHQCQEPRRILVMAQLYARADCSDYI